MPSQKPRPLTILELLSIAALLLAVAVAFEIEVVSPDDPGRGIVLVAIAALSSAAMMLPFFRG